MRLGFQPSRLRDRTPAYLSPAKRAEWRSTPAATSMRGAICTSCSAASRVPRASFWRVRRKHRTECRSTAATEQAGASIRARDVIRRCLERILTRGSDLVELRTLVDRSSAAWSRTTGISRDASIRSIHVSSPQLRSEHRVAAAAVAPTVMPQMLPRLGATAAMIPSLPTPGHQSHLSGPTPFIATYSSQGYSQMMMPAPAAPPATPWWVWFVGGAIAVGLGVGAAVWYAGSSAPTPEPVAAKTEASSLKATPIDTTAEPPQFVELRFDSLPSGGVFAEGQSAELCATPCATKLDMKDGGSSQTRPYVKSPATRHPIDGRLTATQRGSRSPSTSKRP